jgi:putative FmdB family regulatory protein
VPLYEYECQNCKLKFERLVFNDKSEIVCRTCGGSNVTRLLSVFSVAGVSDRAEAEPGSCDTCGAARRGACMLQ